MTFKKSEVAVLLQPTKEMLIRLGHKITSDWLPVKHSGETGTSHVTYAEDRFVDALSILCTDPECNMRFDINESNYGEHTYLFWHGCGCLAEMKIVGTNVMMDRMSPETEKRFICKKIKALI